MNAFLGDRVVVVDRNTGKNVTVTVMSAKPLRKKGTLQYLGETANGMVHKFTCPEIVEMA